jgi:hypothetical protein
MDRVRKPSNSECYTPLLELSRIYRIAEASVIFFGYCGIDCDSLVSHSLQFIARALYIIALKVQFRHRRPSKLAEAVRILTCIRALHVQISAEISTILTGILHSHRRENLKSYRLFIVFVTASRLMQGQYI